MYERCIVCCSVQVDCMSPVTNNYLHNGWIRPLWCQWQRASLSWTQCTICVLSVYVCQESLNRFVPGKGVGQKYSGMGRVFKLEELTVVDKSAKSDSYVRNVHKVTWAGSLWQNAKHIKLEQDLLKPCSRSICVNWCVVWANSEDKIMSVWSPFVLRCWPSFVLCFPPVFPHFLLPLALIFCQKSRDSNSLFHTVTLNSSQSEVTHVVCLTF